MVTTVESSISEARPYIGCLNQFGLSPTSRWFARVMYDFRYYGVFQNMVMYRFRCLVCDEIKSLEYGRRTSSKRHHTAVALGSLVAYKGLDPELAKSIYIASVFRRKTLCNEHFADVVRLCTFCNVKGSTR
ncbi:hypothetical protein Y032_0141g2232 [Ancylostoma ceylanicum]|uniref:Uncharacterized protein n=1 Tax=Ancylostoma ceylanicum TaxID=53326 RepID=A0A016T3V9_9BILA|nr:hypothetical protein Y032_0141g2232 [Ancylostoma ceylanicum]